MSNWSYTRVGAKDGKGIQSITEYYKLSANTTETFSDSTISTWSTSVSQPTSAKPYLLNAELVVYSDGTKEYKAPHVASRYVTDGQAGRGIAGITEYYLATSASSGVTRSTSGWTKTIQTMTSTKKYLWNYEETTYTDASDPSYTNPCIIGVYGDNGDKGDTGAKALQPKKNFTSTYTTIGGTTSWDVSNFNRTPVVGDTFTNLDGSSNTGTWEITAISGSNATFKLLSYVNSKGATGTRGNLTFIGTEIFNIRKTAVAYTLTTASTGITSNSMSILVGDRYINSLTYDVWKCTTAGTASTAKWTYEGRQADDKDNSNQWRFFGDGTRTKYNTVNSSITQSEVSDTNPFGGTSKLWKVTRPANTSASGSATPYTKAVKIESGFNYRYACYVKRTTSSFTDYFGARGYTRGGDAQVLSLAGASVNSAYFTNTNNFGTLNRWYLVIGYVTANGVTTAPSGSGVYDMVTKKKVKDVTNFQFKNITEYTHTGTLIGYTSSATTPTAETSIYISDIRFDKLDGTEPTLEELLNLNIEAKGKGTYISGTTYNKGDIVYYEGTSYICKILSTTNVPTTTADWDVVADKGVNGTSPWTVNCTEPSVCLTCNTSREVTTAKTITIMFNAFQGTTRKACTIETSTLPRGVTQTSNTAATTSADGTLVLTVASGANLGGTTSTYDNATITLTVTANNVAYTFACNLSKQITGSQGTRAIRYLGKTSQANPTTTNPTAWSTINGDWYLNTSVGNVYYRTGNNAWSVITYDGTGTPDYRLLEAIDDILDIGDSFPNNTTVQNLIEKFMTTFIGRLQTYSVQFQSYVASLTSQNPNINDMMIYMGQNPRRTAIGREFQFAISKYLGKIGEQEMWSDKLFTRFLASGALLFGLAGCVQTTEGVYSRAGESWTKVESLLSSIPGGITTVTREAFNGKYLLICSNGNFFETFDFKSVTENSSLKQTVRMSDFVADFYFLNINGEANAIAIGTTKVYKSNDLNTWTNVSALEGTNGGGGCSHGFWKSRQSVVIKRTNKLYISQDFSNWSTITLPSNVVNGSLFFTNDYIFVGNATTTQITIIDKSLNATTKTNPFKTTSYGANSGLYQSDNDIYGFSKSGLCKANQDFSSITVLKTWSLGEIMDNYAVYINRLYFGVAVGNNTISLRYIDFSDATNTVVDTGLELSGFGLFCVVPSKSSLSVFRYDEYNSSYLSIDGDNFHEIKNQSKNYYPNSTFYLDEINLYVSAFVSEEDPYTYDFYLSQGREAGSGIIKETGDRDAGTATFSNNQMFMWANKNSNVSSEILAAGNPTFINTKNRTLIPTTTPSSPENGDIWIE